MLGHPCHPYIQRVTYYDHLLPLHKRQCLVTIIFTNLPSLHTFSFHEMIFILVKGSKVHISKRPTRGMDICIVNNVEKDRAGSEKELKDIYLKSNNYIIMMRSRMNIRL